MVKVKCISCGKIFEAYVNGNIEIFKHNFIYAINPVKKEIIMMAFEHFYSNSNLRIEFEKFMKVAYN